MPQRLTGFENVCLQMLSFLRAYGDEGELQSKSAHFCGLALIQGEGGVQRGVHKNRWDSYLGELINIS